MFKEIKIKHAKFTLLTLLAAVFILTGVGCKGGDKEAQEKAKNVKLTYWTVSANKSALASLVNGYKSEHPNVSIEVKVIKEEDYERALLEAWAEDKGPDIFSVKNIWLPKYSGKISPLPPVTNLPYKIITGTIKKEEEWVLRQRQTYTPVSLQSTFVPQVYTDAVLSEKIYGLPLSFDNLALYYNRDIFNIYNIINAPETWIPFTEVVKTITALDQNNQIIQSAAALGTGYNVNYSVDIASLIMMQNGTKMTEFNSNKVVFDQPIIKAGQKVEPAAQAVLFYTDFANFAKEAYTWNEKFSNSQDAFIKGETSMYFGYAKDLSVIKSRAPGFNFGISYFPQIDGSPIKVNFANYWLETVSAKSSKTEWAWDFLVYATQSKNSEKYVLSANLPAARLDLLESQAQKNPEMRIFNEQSLTAESWYRGKQAEVAYELFRDFITQINEGARASVSNLLQSLANKINQTL